MKYSIANMFRNLRALRPITVRPFSSVRRILPVKKATPVAKSSVSSSATEATEAPAELDIAETATGSTIATSKYPFKDSASVGEPSAHAIDWSDSFHGLGQQPFSKEATDLLLAPIAVEDIEIKPDGLLYLPEIKYRRILNKAFGPGAWGLAPRTETLVTPKQVSREYALICNGRLVSVARGEQDYFGGEERLTTALEGCKSNALMRCCKDLGIASELWDPVFIRKFKKSHCDELFAEHVVTKKKKKLWKLKVNSFEYPYKAC